MKIETFFLNLVKFAGSPALNSTSTLELSKSDMKELTSYLDKENLQYSQDNEQELRFTVNNVNFIAIENDRSEETGWDGRVIEPAQWDAVLSEEDQAIVEQNTLNPGDTAAPTPAPVDEEREEAAEKFLAGETAESVEEEKQEKRAVLADANKEAKIGTSSKSAPSSKKTTTTKR